MKPPVLQGNWMNRLAFDPDSKRSHVESFFLRANSPTDDRALWLRLCLCNSSKHSFAEVWAMFHDRAHGQPIRAAKERYEFDRVSLDVERTGINIGESTIQENYSEGIVRGDNFVITWRLRLSDECAPYQPLPAQWMYQSWVPTAKCCTPHPSARVQGRIEIWDGRHRNSNCTTIAIDQWPGMQGHHWGPHESERFAYCHANMFDNAPAGSFFEIFAGRTRTHGFPLPRTLHDVAFGRLQLGDEVYRFDTWKNFLVRKTQYSPTEWQFDLDGVNATLKGQVRCRPEDVLAMPDVHTGDARPYFFASKFGELTLELQRAGGEKHTLHSSNASLDVGEQGVAPGIIVRH